MPSSDPPSSPNPANHPVERDDGAASDAVHVISPRDIPILNPAAAAALLRLLQRIRRSEPNNESTERP